jgi:Na+/H+ antiporter NhaD/arsenite permease-like protein
MPDLNLAMSGFGIAALIIFIAAYLFVIFEESLDLRKSKPVLIAAGLIWALIGIAFARAGHSETAGEQAKHLLGEFGELFLFLLVAITYVNCLEERRVFESLRTWMSKRRMSYKQVFWVTGIAGFFLSSSLDNLTTALVMGAVILAIGKTNKAFVAMGCINVVVAANAGGAFSPFGDITTLMVWQKGKLEFFEFFHLFFPSVINWLVPATIMSFAIPTGVPEVDEEAHRMKPGSRGVMILFALTIITAVAFRNFLGLPPALGMMLGLGYLQVWSYYLQQTSKRKSNADMMLNSFKEISRVEWDTMLFFFGIIFAVGGLGVLGHLAHASQWLYADYGPTIANITIGALSAIVDNIPLMFAVLTMNPEMDHNQWLLITLTAGVGGSLLSIGSAAGVALMGLARGQYTFGSHLKWTWAIALGYAASIALHLALNGA